MTGLRSALANLSLFLLPFLLIEGAFRLLPVSDPPAIEKVDASTPVARFTPDTAYRYSRDWNFTLVTRKRSNNYGFIHAADFDARTRSPLVTVIGDSFVEANTVDAGDALADVLDAGVAGHGRVYGLGMSGAPLSQYLVYAEYARATFGPRAMVFVIISNDFDESLLAYKSDPRFHYFAEDGSLRRVDYRLTASKRLLRRSAALRYAQHNLEALQRLQLLAGWLRGEVYASEPDGEALERRITESQRAVDLFLEQLPAKSGLGPDAIVFVLDGVRPALYSERELAAAEQGHHARLRRYFASRAGAGGYTVLDMQPAFIRSHRRDGSRFEAGTTDTHWNALAHRLAADEVRTTAAFVHAFAATSSR